jgi:hypothetical protein
MRKNDVLRLLDIDKYIPSLLLSEVPFDSLLQIKVIFYCEDNFNVLIDPKSLEALITLQDLLDFINGLET